MKQLTAKSTYRVGQKVRGVYFGQLFSGELTDETRPTPDYKNIQFVVKLDYPIVVNCSERRTIYLLTNSEDKIYS